MSFSAPAIAISRTGLRKIQEISKREESSIAVLVQYVHLYLLIVADDPPISYKPTIDLSLKLLPLLRQACHDILFHSCSSTNGARLRRSGRLAVAAAFPRRFLSSVTTLSDLDAVEKYTQLNTKCVLYYTATWCGPCKQIKPVYEKMAQENPNVALGKIDVDDNPDAAAAAAISAVPTFIAYHHNDSVAQFAGADQEQLKTMLAKLNEAK